MSSHETTIEEAVRQLQSSGNVPAELLEIYSEEADDHLRTIYEGFNRVKEKNDDLNALAEIRRASHTLKGAAAAVGLEAVTKLAHRMEDLLDRLAENKLAASSQQLALLLTTTDQIQEMTSGQIEVDAVAQQLVDIYAAYSEQLAPFGESAVSTSQNSGPQNQPIPTALPAGSNSASPPAHRPAGGAKDKPATQYLRVPLNKLDDLVGLISEMIVNRSAIERRLGDFETRIEDIHEALGRMRKLNRDMEHRTSVDSLCARSSWSLDERREDDAAAFSQNSRSQFLDSLEFDQYTHFQLVARSLAESNNDVEMVTDELCQLKSDLDGLVRKQQRLGRAAQNSLMHIRMVPLGGIVSRLERTVRSVSAKLDRSVELQVIGENTELDKTVLDEIADPLQHLIRNAIDHGTETREQRIAAGKPEQARIRLEAINQANQVTIRISDDGRGINLEKVREKAIQQKLITADAELTAEELHCLIFLPGFTTAAQLTDVSGRGVGMDVVREGVAKLNGTIRVDSQPGIGTTFTIQLPTSVGVSRALLVESAGSKYAIPIQSVSNIQRLDPANVRANDEQTVVVMDDQDLELKQLSRHLNLNPGGEHESFERPDPMLVIRVGEDRVAVVVDAIEAAQDILVKPLGDHLRNVPGLIGATVRGDGSIIPILDPVDLIGKSSAIATPLNSERETAVPVRPSLAMVIDDSVSVRRVSSSLLERCGWQVVTAKDGVDALEKLDELESAPDVFLCDMEMPRMDGIELIKRIRKQSEFAITPIVMVTSRASEKHRHMAIDAGATEYVVKPFNDEQLMSLVDELVQASRETVAV